MNAIHRRLPGSTRGVLLAASIAVSLVAPLQADELKDGQKALQNGQYDQALQLFETAAKQGLAAGRAGVGQVWLRRRQLDKAMEAFQLAQRMDGSLAMAWYGQGEVLRRQNKCAEAIPMLEKANELDSKFPDAKLALGDCFIQTKNHAKAVQTLTDGLKWGARWRPRFLVALGNAEASRDSLRDAAIYYTKAREEAPSDPAVRKALGDFYMQRGTWALAILEHQAAVQLDSTDVELRYSLGQALYYDKRYNDALDEYTWVTRRDPDFAPAQLALGNLLYLAGAADPRRYVEAEAPLRKYTQLEPADGKGWSLLGRVLFSLRQNDEALAAMLKAEQLGDKSKDMYNDLGKLYAARREWDKALEAFEKGDPGPKELLTMAQMRVFQGQSAAAESLYRAIVEKDSTSGDARFALVELGKLQFREAAKTKDPAHFQAAVSTLNRRNALDPKSGEAYYFIGLSYKEMKQNADAIAALQQAAAIDSAKADRHFWLGVVLETEKRMDEARAAYERAAALDDSSNVVGAKARRQLGFFRLLGKDWSGAVDLLDRATTLDPKDSQAWLWLGQAQQNSGNRSKALEAYRKTLEINPANAEAKKGIQVLQGG
jgi:tetratricopeptide (TPR) repeat protein